MTNESEWEAPSLDLEDEALISAYVAIGQSVDELPHTEAMTALVSRLDKDPTEASKHAVFKRLLRMRKMGVLPRISTSSSSTSSSSSSVAG